MKYITITTLAAMLLGTVGAFAVEPSVALPPSGFVTHTLKAGKFNLIGLTLHEPVTVTGSFETVNGTTLTDSNAKFGTTLTANKTYILEITDAAIASLNGTIQEVTVWSGDTITTPQNLVTDGLAVGDKYQLRQAATIGSVFGAANTSGLVGGAFAEADILWLQDSGEPSGYAKYYYKSGGFGGAEWRNHRTDAAIDASVVAIIYTDGFFIQSQSATDGSVIITGSVKTKASIIAITDQFSFLSGVYPVGATLLTSGLEASIEGGAFAEADIIWLPNGTGYDKFYYKSGGFGGAEWRTYPGDVTVAADVDLTAGLILQRQNGVQGNIKSNAPAGYENL